MSMKLKFKFKAKDEIPSDHLPLYAERDGAWFLDVDGAVDKSRLDELLHSNATLARQRDELKNRFEGIDPDQVRALAEEKRRLEEAQQLKAGEIEKVFDSRLRNVR